MIVTQREREVETQAEGEAETQAEGEAGSMHREPDVGFDPWSPGSRPGPKAGAKPLRHPGFPQAPFIPIFKDSFCLGSCCKSCFLGILPSIPSQE